MELQLNRTISTPKLPQIPISDAIDKVKKEVSDISFDIGYSIISKPVTSNIAMPMNHTNERIKKIFKFSIYPLLFFVWFFSTY